MSEDVKTWIDDQHCFLCGHQNSYGLQLDFVAEGETLRTRWVAEKRFQGYAEVLHGGIISAVLDEVMINLPWKLHNAPVTTAELTVRFLAPAPIGMELHFIAHVVKPGRRLWELRSECVGADGIKYAEATAKAMPIKFQPYQGPRP
jgi:uncharacterized protein (TIGR00369 family)